MARSALYISLKVTRSPLFVEHSKIVKVTNLYRKTFAIYVERVGKEQANEASVPIGIALSNIIICKPKLDKFRKKILEHKNRGVGVVNKSK